MLPELPGQDDGAAQSSFAPETVCNCQRPDFKLRDVSGEVSVRLLAATQGDQGLSGAAIPASLSSRRVLCNCGNFY